MKRLTIPKELRLQVILMAVTAVLITVTGIYFMQDFLRILPLYISLFVGAMQTRASRFAPLVGSFNSILYGLTSLYMRQYASMVSEIGVSFPVQLVTFLLWSKRKVGGTTKFRKLSKGWRIVLAAGFVIAYVIVMFVLEKADGNNAYLDNASALLANFIYFLTMFAFIEYTWLMIPSGIITILLRVAMIADDPSYVTYLIFAIYSMICTVRQFFRVRALYKEQQAAETK